LAYKNYNQYFLSKKTTCLKDWRSAYEVATWLNEVNGKPSVW